MQQIRIKNAEMDIRSMVAETLMLILPHKFHAPFFANWEKLIENHFDELIDGLIRCSSFFGQTFFEALLGAYSDEPNWFRRRDIFALAAVFHNLLLSFAENDSTPTFDGVKIFEALNNNEEPDWDSLKQKDFDTTLANNIVTRLEEIGEIKYANDKQKRQKRKRYEFAAITMLSRANTERLYRLLFYESKFHSSLNKFAARNMLKDFETFSKAPTKALIINMQSHIERLYENAFVS